MKITAGGVVAAEWTKFSSLRSTWITTGISVFLLVAFGMIASASFSGDGLTSVDLALSGSTLAALSVGVLGALLGAGEYTTGMIRATLAAVPRRLPVLWSKSLVAGSAAFVTMTAGAFAAFAAGSAVLNDKLGAVGLGDDGVLRALLGAGLYLGLVAVLGVALGMLVRSSAGAIAILAGLLLIVPGLAALLPELDLRGHHPVPAQQRRQRRDDADSGGRRPGALGRPRGLRRVRDRDARRGGVPAQDERRVSA